MLFLICMILSTPGEHTSFIQRTEQVPIELDISAIEEYVITNIIIIIINKHPTHQMFYGPYNQYRSGMMLLYYIET